MSEVAKSIATDGQAAATVIVAILAAAFAALGFLGKLALDEWRAWIDRKRTRAAKLVELASLLRASRAVFVKQNDLATQLVESIRNSQPILLPLFSDPRSTYEDIFEAAYSEFTKEQQQLFGVIRSMTQHAMHHLNEKMLAWLENDSYFKGQRRTGSATADLATLLARLEAHLNMWRAKYAYWIAADPRHALVYLNDEAEQGVGFPSELDGAVERLLTRK
jgi:hypothetical protein